MIDIEDLTVKIGKDIEHFQARYNLSHREVANILLHLGVATYLKDMATRQLNGNKSPYLADFHLRQGIKYYHQDLVRQP
jgi:hypothetical protein